mgnify:CR=1 FL=1|jgi:hypothetical protein
MFLLFPYFLDTANEAGLTAILFVCEKSSLYVENPLQLSTNRHTNKGLQREIRPVISRFYIRGKGQLFAANPDALASGLDYLRWMLYFGAFS